MTKARAVAGSFRDPAGRVYEHEGSILRTVTKAGVTAFDAVRDTGFLDRLVQEQRLLDFRYRCEPELLATFAGAECILEHPRLQMISHPYEWCFGQLRSAALLHLDIALDALEAGLTLSDASGYNIQFVGHRPIFIDHLSFRPYRDGEFWLAHRQFCEHFLNPLLLRAMLGVPYNPWYRGGLEGVPTEQIARLLPWRTRLSLRMNAHVYLPARFQRRAQSATLRASEMIKPGVKLPKRGYEGLLRQLRNWVASMSSVAPVNSAWGDYARDNTYGWSEVEEKRRVVAEFADIHRPVVMLDLGCNSGYFAEAALSAGAGTVIGFDSDHDALEQAYKRAVDHELSFLPLFLDASNPSPSQGWAQQERTGFDDRAKGDAVAALAFIHHLAIGKNIPLDEVVTWIIGRAPVGLIEFVPKSDPTVHAMLRYRDDIFDGYAESEFVACLSRQVSIKKSTIITATGRTIYEYERPQDA